MVDKDLQPAAVEDDLPPVKKDRYRKSGTARLFRLAKKELLEILRDRRTIITLVLMPILVYPLMGMVIQRFMVRSILQTGDTVQTDEYRIAFENQRAELSFTRDLMVGDNFVRWESDQKKAAASKTEKMADEANNQNPDQIPEQNPAEPQTAEPVIPEFGPSEDSPKIMGVYPESKEFDIRQMVVDGTVDLGVRFMPRRERMQKFAKYELIFRKDSPLSVELKKYVEDRLMATSRVWAASATGPLMNFYMQSNRNKPANEVRPFNLSPTFTDVDVTVVAGVSKAPMPSILSFIPLMLVLMTITGAVYPAIDLTAGERERGTMEILVAAPVSRMSLLFGKFVAVIVVAMLTAIFNMVAMLITVYTLGLDRTIFGEAGLTIGVAAMVLVLLLVFAAFFSATLLGVTSFARSFKEAQAYLIPLMLIALGPGLIGLTPNLEMDVLLAIVPLLNIVLTARDLLAGNVNWMLLAISVVTTILYGLLAMSVAAKVFGADSVLAGGGSSWSDLIRRTPEREDQPSIASAMFFLAILFPAFIVVNGLASRTGGEIPTDPVGLQNLITRNLIINAIVTFALFVVLPLIFTALMNLRRRSTFYFTIPNPLALLAAILVGVSVWTLIYEVNMYSLSKERVEALAKMFESMKLGMGEVSLPLKLLCLAVAPAVCEELTFRGFLLSAFRKRSSTIVAIVATALLFGLFHVFVRDVLFFERLLPTTLMGLLLGWICVKTGSIWPGILLHVIHNGLMISIGHYEQTIKSWGVDMADRQHLPMNWILIALIPLVLGLVMFWILKPAKPAISKPE